MDKRHAARYACRSILIFYLDIQLFSGLSPLFASLDELVYEVSAYEVSAVSYYHTQNRATDLSTNDHNSTS